MKEKEKENKSPPISLSVLCEKYVGVSEGGVIVGSDAPNCRWTDSEVEAVRVLREGGFSYRQISKKMEMPTSTVHAICTGQLRAAFPVKWIKVNVKRRKK